MGTGGDIWRDHLSQGSTVTRQFSGVLSTGPLRYLAASEIKAICLSLR